MNASELRKRVSELPALPDRHERFTWLARRASLRHKIATSDPAKFLQWPVCKEALFVGDPDCIMREYSELTASSLWLRYARAVLSPDFGSPDRGRLSPYDGTIVHQLYHLMQWESRSDKTVDELSTIVEFGAGYGTMAMLCRRLGFTGRYVTQDFPELMLLQEFYLTNVGIDDVECGGTPEDIDLFIALFSKSETELEYRTMLDASNYLIGYQPKWDGWDNEEYFDRFSKSKSDLVWFDYHSVHFGNHKYLIGLS